MKQKVPSKDCSPLEGTLLSHKVKNDCETILTHSGGYYG
jgi:hypothetical protein